MPLAVIAVGVVTRASPAQGMSGAADLGTSRKFPLVLEQTPYFPLPVFGHYPVKA